MVSRLLLATTTDNVTGNLKAIDWNNHKKRWDHLKDWKFPVPARKYIVDVFIGLDHADLHAPLDERIGRAGEPLARLTPLGWTCVGCPTEAMKYKQLQTFFVRTDKTTLDDVNQTLRKFWEVENCGVSETETQMSVEEKSALQTVKESLTQEDGRYQVGIPWKSGREPDMKSNYNMAMKRLICMERKLQKQPTTAENYQSIINDYLDKGYVRKIPDGEKEPNSCWYLPHFAVLRPDKNTTKTRIVFDGSAKYNDTSLNENIYQGPKLQTDLFMVLLRFRRYPVMMRIKDTRVFLDAHTRAGRVEGGGWRGVAPGNLVLGCICTVGVLDFA